MRITDPFDQYDYLPCFSPRLAASLGRHCEGQAILLHQIEFWLSKPKVGKIVSQCVDKKHRVVRNRKWVKEKLSDFIIQFPNTSRSTLRRTLNSLINKDLIIATSDINHAKFDRTTWYTVNFDKLWDIFKHSKFTDKIGDFRKTPRTPKDVDKLKQDMQKYQTPYVKSSQSPSLRKGSKRTVDTVKKTNSSAQSGQMQMSKVDRPSVQVGHHYTLNIPKSPSKLSTTLKKAPRAQLSNSQNRSKPSQPIRNKDSAPELNKGDYLERIEDRRQYLYQQFDSKVFNLFSHVLTDAIPASLDGYTRMWFFTTKVDTKLVQVAIDIALQKYPDSSPSGLLSYVNGILKNMSLNGYHTYRHYHRDAQDKQIVRDVHNGTYVKRGQYHKRYHRSTSQSPQPADDNGKASVLQRTAQVVHIQLTGNLDKESKRDFWRAKLICKSDNIYCARTGINLDSIDPKKKTTKDFQEAANELNSQIEKSRKSNQLEYSSDDIKKIAEINRKFYDF